MSTGTERRPPRLRAAVRLAGIVLLLGVVSVLARGAPYTQPPREPDRSAASTAAPVTAVGAPDDALAERFLRDARGLASLPPLQILIVIIVVIFVVLTGFAVLVLLGIIRAPRRRRRTSAGTAVDPAPGGRPGPELVEAVDHALDLVEHGDAAEAVVACWLLMVRAAGDAGSPARPSETAREYAERLSVEQLVSPGPLARLADLYREARFSAHPVGPELRAQARRALGVLQAELRSGVRL